jgi:hypothetical protein
MADVLIRRGRDIRDICAQKRPHETEKAALRNLMREATP